jgi:menaquinone-dependent protoporphyrinogen oxidase
MSLVLVAYETKYGSTKEVAEAVAKALRQAGVDTELREAHQAKDLDGFAAVVLGAPLYYFHWNRHARKFLDHHKEALAAMPVAVFALGPTNDTPKDFEDARGGLDKALAEREWLDPVSVKLFGGKLDHSVLRFPDSNPAMKKMPDSDIRDWDAIAEWAKSLPGAMGLVAAR